MIEEIVEALLNFYAEKEEEQVLIDCLIYMKDKFNPNKMSYQRLDNLIESYGYCSTCGEKLIDILDYEIHKEFGYPFYTEEILTKKCPNCD